MELIANIILFALLTTITPGPNNIMLMSSGLNFGIKKSLPHLVGVCIGFPILVIFIGSGGSIIFNEYPILYQVLKIAGFGYLLFLAYKIATTVKQDLGNETSKPFSFFQAVLFQWINPKAWIIAVSAITIFTTSSVNIYSQTLVIATVFLFVDIFSASFWLTFGIILTKIIQKPKSYRIFNRTMAVLLVVSIIPAFSNYFVTP